MGAVATRESVKIPLGVSEGTKAQCSIPAMVPSHGAFATSLKDLASVPCSEVQSVTHYLDDFTKTTQTADVVFSTDTRLPMIYIPSSAAKELCQRCPQVAQQSLTTAMYQSEWVSYLRKHYQAHEELKTGSPQLCRDIPTTPSLVGMSDSRSPYFNPTAIRKRLALARLYSAVGDGGFPEIMFRIDGGEFQRTH